MLRPTLRRSVLTAAALSLVATLPSLARAAALDLVAARAPAVNCLFSSDCRLGVSDTLGAFSLPGASGEGRLQSRTVAVGAPGTPGAGLWLHLYRVDLGDLTAFANGRCVDAFELRFAGLARLDYDGDGNLDDGFVLTGGAVGQVGPSVAEITGTTVRVRFGNVCAGVSSFFIGLASRNAPVDGTATIIDELGGTIVVRSKVPVGGASTGARFVRGDVDGSGQIEVSDAVTLLGVLFRGEGAVDCHDAADTDDNGRLELTDAIAGLRFLFLGGTPPAAPFPTCGVDPTTDTLDCAEEPATCGEVRCPDPAVTAIDFTLVRRDTTFRGRVRITGRVRNQGGAYRSNPGQQSIVLEELPLGGLPRIVAQRDFEDLEPGQEVTVEFERNWDISSPAEGEFPPDYRVRILYDPDIASDGNSENDDCGAANNSRERSGTEIRPLFS